jgi:acyl dehydratase
MAVPLRHVLSQGPVLAAFGRAALSGLRPRSGAPSAPSTLPGPWLEAELPPRPEALVRDYVRHVGGDPASYRGRVPAHLFPQWGTALAARALATLPYPLARVINAGCRIEQRAPLPSGERLLVRARIEAIDEDERRALVTQRIITGTAGAPDAVVADLVVYVPLVARGERAGAVRERASVPGTAHELAFLRIGADAGLDFAKLTGDFNPIHWLAPYARAAGFRACILHGFATLARAIEVLNRARFAGDASRLAVVDVRFTRPLVLPARVGVYVEGNGLWVGDAPGGAAALTGHFETERGT